MMNSINSSSTLSSKSSAQRIQSYSNQLLDRYVPPRAFRPHQPLWNVYDLVNRAEEADQPNRCNVFNQCLGGTRARSEYRRLLARTLFEDMSNYGDRVLPLWRASRPSRASCPSHFSCNSKSDVSRCTCQAFSDLLDRDEVPTISRWPSRPRSSPLVGRPFYKVDVPNVPSSSLSSNVLAWSQGGLLAAASCDWVSVWKQNSQAPPPVQLAHRLDVTPDQAIAVAWCCSSGRPVLAIGTRRSFLQIWDCWNNWKVAERLTHDSKAPCALAWHPTDINMLIVGTAGGTVTAYDASTLLLCQEGRSKAHVRVTRLCFVKEGSFLVSGGAEGFVVLWDWPNLEPLFETDTRATVTALSWHPWRDTTVAVGSLHGAITLVNFSSMDVLKASFTTADSRPSVLSALSFAPRTGELVAAFRAGPGPSHGSRASPGTRGRGTHLLVLADLLTVVDRLEEHETPVRSLQWSPDGADLATMDVSGHLCLWNFLGEKASRKARKEFAQDARDRRLGVSQQFGCIIR